MVRSIIITIEDDTRSQTAIDIAAMKLMDSIQEKHFNDSMLRVSRPARFTIKATILSSIPETSDEENITCTEQ